MAGEPEALEQLIDKLADTMDRDNARALEAALVTAQQERDKETHRLKLAIDDYNEVKAERDALRDQVAHLQQANNALSYDKHELHGEIADLVSQLRSLIQQWRTLAAWPYQGDDAAGRKATEEGSQIVCTLATQVEALLPTDAPQEPKA